MWRWNTLVDEDFVMGYVCGYNNAGGGASGGSWLDDIPLIKKYKLVGTDCAIGIADPESDKVRVVTNWQYYSDGDNATVMDRIKWCPEPYYIYKPIILIFFMADKAIGYCTPYQGISDYFTYQNAVNTPPYSDTWILSSKEESFYDELKIEAKTTLREYSSSNTNEECAAILSYTYHSERWDKSTGKTTLGSTVTKNAEIFRKSRSDNSGHISVTVSNSILSNFAGVGNQWLKPEYLRDVLDAWFKCTGMEEVQI